VFVTFGCVITSKRWTTTRTKKKDNNWNSLLRHSSYDQRQEKKAEKTHESTRYHLSTKGNRGEKTWNFFFHPARFVHKSRRQRGATGERGACRLWVQPMVREELEGKGIWRQIPLTIGSSVRDKQRYDRSEDEKQMEPIIIKSTHRFLCTRQAKIRSKRRRKTDGTYHHQINA